MITLFNSLHLDTTVTAMVAFVVALSLIAIYKMHDLKDGLLFLLYISGSIALIALFVIYPSVSAILIFMYMMRLVYRNTHSAA